MPTHDPKTILSLTLSGEVSTKSPRTRKRFHGRLRANLRAMLDRHGLGGRIHDRWERIDIEAVDAEAAGVLARVFGVQSVRVAREIPWQAMDELVTAGTALFADKVKGHSFAVRARRVGPREHIPLDSE